MNDREATKPRTATADRIGSSPSNWARVLNRPVPVGGLGLVYHPAPSGGYANAGIYVCEK